MAGPFIETKYESNGGTTFAVKVQPETLLLSLNSKVNAAGAGTVSNGLPSAIATGSRRKIGVHCRTVSFKFTAAPAEGGYVVGDRLTLPVMTEAAWDLYVRGSVGTYLGAAIVRTGQNDEVIN